MKEYSSFGEMLHNERLAKDLTLREYCRTYQLDPGKISKIENDLIPLPKNSDLLDKIAESLDIAKGSEDYKFISDLASATRKEIPTDLQSNIGLLPAFCRKARMNNLKEKDLEELVKLITQSNESNKKIQQETDR